MKRVLLVVVFIAFSLFTAIAVWQHGIIGIIEPHFKNIATAQVFVDLVIALSLFLCWMWRDAKLAGRNPIPWLILVLATGSIAALLYLIIYKSDNKIS